MINNSRQILDNFFNRLATANSAILILDYDGTLAPFSTDPQHAPAYPKIFDLIKKIMDQSKTEVVICSGRDLQSLKRHVKLSPLPELWGSHGGERLLAGASVPEEMKYPSDIKLVLANARKEALHLAPDLYCEVKPLSVALHWRGKEVKMSQEQRARVLEQWKKHCHQHHFQIHEFDGGLELRPEGMNKGEVITQLLQDHPFENLIAYIGDDVTDEEAFAALGEKGLKILVHNQSRPTKADVQLSAPEGVFDFLNRWYKSRSH